MEVELPCAVRCTRRRIQSIRQIGSAERMMSRFPGRCWPIEKTRPFFICFCFFYRWLPLPLEGADDDVPPSSGGGNRPEPFPPFLLVRSHWEQLNVFLFSPRRLSTELNLNEMDLLWRRLRSGGLRGGVPLLADIRDGNEASNWSGQFSLLRPQCETMGTGSPNCSRPPHFPQQMKTCDRLFFFWRQLVQCLNVRYRTLSGFDFVLFVSSRNALWTRVCHDVNYSKYF